MSRQLGSKSECLLSLLIGDDPLTTLGVAKDRVDDRTLDQIGQVSQVIARGGGGTCMDRIVNKVLSEPENQLPDLLILVTDGGTDWPAKHKTPFVACVTRTKGCYMLDTPPEWMPLVHVA